MLARHLRYALLLQLAGGALLAAWWAGWSTPSALLFAVAAGIATPVLISAVALAVEVLVGAMFDPQAPRAGLGTMLRVWWIETVVSVRAFAWRQPFLADFPDPPIRRSASLPAVLLVHGYACNRAVWRPLIDSGLLRDANVATLNLEPPMAGIATYAEPIRAAVDALRAASGAARVTLVCHSMGGLAARAYLRAHGESAIERVITIATPHAGTIFGYLGVGTNAHQMARGSPFVDELVAATTALQRALFVCVASRDDNLIVPRSSPLLAGAVHHVVCGIGHLAMIEDRRVWAIVAETIAADRSRMPAAAASTA